MRYKPNSKEEQTIKSVYDDFTQMRKMRNKRWEFFNDRSLKDFIDDSQLRLTGYVPTKEAQGKESWQANVFHPVTRNKFKAILAAVALDVPQVKITAQNEKQRRDANRADVMRHLVKFSYSQDNKEEQVFFETWEAAEKGTVIVYDGYLKAKSKKKIITSYDPSTGDIETDEQDVETDNQCVNFIVPLMNMYIKDWQVFDIQKQPSLCWVERMTPDAFKTEFGKYPKASLVPESNKLTEEQEQDTFFRYLWQDRVNEDEPIEVIRYYNKAKDQFAIIANGVILFESPLILGKTKKYYPFAKTVFEPFATDFFYGNSLPNTLMGEQDVINSLYNMALDRTYKSMAPALLIGNANKDDFDLEDQNTTIDTKIYVQDINQVREMPISGVNQSDVKMIEIISRGLDLTSVDSNQQGVAGRGVTAREVVIANENAKKLKGMLYMFIKSLWLQKIKLRIMNILIYYTSSIVQKVVSEQGENIIDQYRKFAVDNAELSDGTKGTMEIEVVGSPSKLPTPEQLTVQEETARMQSGERYEKVVITNDYLDNWHYDIKVESESIYETDSNLSQSKMEEKLRVLGTYFPQILMNNQEKLVTDTLIAYEDDPDEYSLMQQQPLMGEPTEAGAEEGAELATAGQQGMPALPAL